MYIFSGELSPEARLRLKNEERFFNFRIHKRLLVQSFLGYNFTNLFAKLFRLIFLQRYKRLSKWKFAKCYESKLIKHTMLKYRLNISDHCRRFIKVQLKKCLRWSIYNEFLLKSLKLDLIILKFSIFRCEFYIQIKPSGFFEPGDLHFIV